MDAAVPASANRLLRSGRAESRPQAFTKQFIEEVGKMSFDYIELRFSDRQRVRAYKDALQ
jgi:hypothetical protein